MYRDRLEELTKERDSALQTSKTLATKVELMNDIIQLTVQEQQKQQAEDDELIEPIAVPLAAALQMVWRGELNDAKSALALIHAARYAGRLA